MSASVASGAGASGAELDRGPALADPVEGGPTWSAPRFRKAEASMRSRTWNRRTRESSRGLMAMPWDLEFETLLHNESGLEWKGVLGLVGHPDVRRIWEQPSAVSYLDGTGKKRTHTVDLLVLMADGTRRACLVKPRHKATGLNYEGLIRSLAAQVPRSFADEWVLLQEGKLTRNVVRNGQTILRVKLDGPFSDDPAVAVAASVATSAMRVRDIVAACAGAADFWAVVRLVADGRLKVRDHALLDLDAIVEPITRAAP